MSQREGAVPLRRTMSVGDIRFLALVLTIGAALLLCRLDDAYLWQDEAETALVARHLMYYGLPLSSDGTDWVQQAGERFIEFTRDYVWIYHSWLQYALVAASFAILGPSTLAARLPFVLIGLVTFVLFYRFVLHATDDRRVARVAVLLLLFYVPFLLLIRQCRYYSLAAFASLLTLDAYLWLWSDKSWAVPYFVLSASLLYHSHYGAFFPTLAAICAHWLLSGSRGCAPRRYWSAVAVVLILVLPWAMFMRVAERGQPFRIDRFLAHVGQYVVYATGWIIPLAFLVLLTVAWMRRGRPGALALSPLQAEFCSLAGMVVLGNVLVLSATAAFDWVYFRYMVHLIPLLLSMLAIAVVQISGQRAVLAGALVVLALGTNVLCLIPYGLPGLRDCNVAALVPESTAFLSLQEVWQRAGYFRSDLLMYAQELAHSYQGPNEGLVAYLSLHAAPGQSLAVNYEDLPLMFYTRLHVIGGLGVHDLDVHSRPDWIVDRVHGPYRELLGAILTSGPYERLTLPYPDIRWENRPEPGTHQYLTVQDAEPVVLYRRTKG